MHRKSPSSTLSSASFPGIPGVRKAVMDKVTFSALASPNRTANATTETLTSWMLFWIWQLLVEPVPVIHGGDLYVHDIPLSEFA